MEGGKKASELMQEVKSEIFKEYKKKPFSLRVIPLMIRNNSTFVKWLEAY